MNAYTEPASSAADFDTMTAAEIDALFKHKTGWFSHSRVRRKLYKRGFPHPVSAGRWSKLAVGNWFLTAGDNPEGELPAAERPAPKRRRGRGRNGYAEP